MISLPISGTILIISAGNKLILVQTLLFGAVVLLCNRLGHLCEMDVMVSTPQCSLPARVAAPTDATPLAVASHPWLSSRVWRLPTRWESICWRADCPPSPLLSLQEQLSALSALQRQECLSAIKEVAVDKEAPTLEDIVNKGKRIQEKVRRLCPQEKSALFACPLRYMLFASDLEKMSG